MMKLVMKMNSLDLRVKKTKKNIYEALIHLLEEKTFESIKVSEICEVSMINRSTFYAHFEDKYALLDSFIKDLKNELKKVLETNTHITNTKEYYLKMIELLLNHIEEEKKVYTAIIQNNRNSVAMDMIYDALKEDIEKRIEKEKINSIEIPCEFIANFYLGAIFNIGMEWLRTNSSYTKQEIIKYLDQLLSISPFYSKEK